VFAVTVNVHNVPTGRLGTVVSKDEYPLTVTGAIAAPGHTVVTVYPVIPGEEFAGSAQVTIADLNSAMAATDEGAAGVEYGVPYPGCDNTPLPAAVMAWTVKAHVVPSVRPVAV